MESFCCESFQYIMQPSVYATMQNICSFIPNMCIVANCLILYDRMQNIVVSNLTFYFIFSNVKEEFDGSSEHSFHSILI